MSTIAMNPAIFGAPFLLIVVGIGWLLVWIAEKSAAAAFFKSCAGVVAPLSSLLALLFGLFTAFLANDIFIHTERARASVEREAAAIRVVLSLADGLGERGRTLRETVVDLARTSTGADWRSPRQISAVERQSLKAIKEVMFGGLAAADAEVRHAAIQSIMDIRAAGGERIAAANSKTREMKWFAAFALGVLTQIAVVVVHLGKPRAALLAVTVFGTGMAFMLWVILARHDPFGGVAPVSLQPIKAAYQQPP